MKPALARGLALALIALALLVPAAFAADAAPADPLPAISEAEAINPFEKGSQTIGLSADFQVPLFTFGGDATTTKTNLKLGGSFSFQYQNFVSRGLAIGGTVSGAFNGSIAGRSLFIAPLSFRTAYWWALIPFEFCVGAEAGVYLLRFDGKGTFGPFAKAGGAAYWKASPQWSLGLEAYYWLVPEIHTGDYASLTRVGNFLQTGISAVYHL